MKSEIIHVLINRAQWDGDPSVREAACWAMGRICKPLSQIDSKQTIKPKIIDELIAPSAQANQQAPIEAAQKTLNETSDPKAIYALLNVAQRDQVSSVQIMARWALSHIGGQEIIDDLLKLAAQEHNDDFNQRVCRL